MTFFLSDLYLRNAKQMPIGVADALKQVFVTAGGKTEAEAAEFLAEMEKQRRYQVETWS